MRTYADGTAVLGADGTAYTDRTAIIWTDGQLVRGGAWRSGNVVGLDQRG